MSVRKVPYAIPECRRHILLGKEAKVGKAAEVQHSDRDHEGVISKGSLTRVYRSLSTSVYWFLRQRDIDWIQAPFSSAANSAALTLDCLEVTILDRLCAPAATWKDANQSSTFLPAAAPTSCCAICSNDFPCVSSSPNQLYAAMTTSKMPQSKNVPQPRCLIMYGVVREKTKLKSHWLATPAATPASRVRVGKI